MKRLTCEECPFYTDIQCHGHGEFWGECILINQAYKNLEKRCGKSRHISVGFRNVCYDDTECLFIKYKIFEVEKL